MYDSILVPVDESELSEQAVEQALAIAEEFGSTIHVMHVTEERGSNRISKSVSELGPNSSERREMDERREKLAEELTTEITKQARKRGQTAEQIVLTGDPAEAITDYAAEEDISLIVLGTKGRSAVGKFLLGDVAGKVARHATTSVLLVRSDDY